MFSQDKTVPLHDDPFTDFGLLSASELSLGVKKLSLNCTITRNASFRPLRNRSAICHVRNSHWVALLNLDNVVYFFDPLGDIANTENHDIDLHLKIQAENSNLCGNACLFFIKSVREHSQMLKMYKQKDKSSMIQAVLGKYFDFENPLRNDMMLIHFTCDHKIGEEWEYQFFKNYEKDLSNKS